MSVFTCMHAFRLPPPFFRLPGSPCHRAMLLWSRPGNTLSWSECLQLSCGPAYIAEPAAPLSETKEVNKKPRQPKARSPKQLKAAALPKKQKKQGRGKPACGKKKPAKKEVKEEVKKEGKSGLEEAWLDSETVSFQEFVRVTDLIQAFDLSTPRHKKELPGLAPKAFWG